MWKPFLIFSSQNIERVHFTKIALLALQNVFEPDFQLFEHWTLQYHTSYVDKMITKLYNKITSYGPLRKTTSSAYGIFFSHLFPPLYLEIFQF